MSSTRRPVEAIEHAKTFIKNMPIEKAQVEILNQIKDMMWMASPWRWTVGVLEPFKLVANTSDYAITMPSDFMYAIHAFVADGSTAPRTLEVVPQLPSDVKLVGQPNFMAYEGLNLGGKGIFRVSPKPGTTIIADQYVTAYYKKESDIIDAKTMHDTGYLGFDDEWFWVYCHGVLWLCYMWGDDRRAGDTTYREGQAQFSGQLALFMSGIGQMQMREKLPDYQDRQAQDTREVRR